VTTANKNGYRTKKKFGCDHPEKFEYDACGLCLSEAYDLLERAIKWTEASHMATIPNWLTEAKEFCRPSFDYSKGVPISQEGKAANE
jgi:hypothetical protein